MAVTESGEPLEFLESVDIFSEGKDDWVSVKLTFVSVKEVNDMFDMPLKEETV